MNGDLVEKSRALIYADYRGWTKQEQNLLETYLARINARDPGTILVTFTKDEYRDLLGIKDLRPATMNKYLNGIMNKKVNIKLDDGRIGKYVLFPTAMYDPDFDTIRIKCNEDLKEIFFNIAENGYQSYKLKYILKLDSVYSKRLYNILKDQSFKGTWEVNLKELREMIGAIEKSWEVYPEFNRRILKIAQDQINECTDIKISYTGKRIGGCTRKVIFTIENKEKKPKKVINKPINGRIEVGTPEYKEQPSKLNNEELQQRVEQLKESLKSSK